MKNRPISAQLVDLHVYVIPEENWIAHRKLAENSAVVNDAISAGFIRVLPTMKLDEIREQIFEQLGLDNVPLTFVILRSVGRNFTQVKPHQENELKVKYFCPPFAAEPELYLKSGDYQEGDSAAQLDFEVAAAATSTPLGPTSGSNSASNDSQDPGTASEPENNQQRKDGIPKPTERKSSVSSLTSKKDDKLASKLTEDSKNNNNTSSSVNAEESQGSENNTEQKASEQKASSQEQKSNEVNSSTTKSGAKKVIKGGTDGRRRRGGEYTTTTRRGLSKGLYKGESRSLPINQAQRVGHLPSDEERETYTFRESFVDVHETSVVDLRSAAFLNRSAPDLAGGDNSFYLGNKLNSTTSNLSVGRSRYGHSLHDLNGETVTSHTQRRSKYHSKSDEVDAGGKSSTRRQVVFRKKRQLPRSKQSAVVQTTTVSLIDDSGKLENLHYEPDEILRKYRRDKVERPSTSSSMSLSIAVSVKEIGDTTTQTKGTGDDGSDPKTTEVTSAANQQTNDVKTDVKVQNGEETADHNAPEQNNDAGEDTVDHNHNTDNPERKSETRSPDTKGRAQTVTSPLGNSVPILDADGNEVGDIEIGVAGSIENMISTVAVVTNAISATIEAENNTTKAEEKTEEPRLKPREGTSMGSRSGPESERDTPSTDIAAMGYYESDVTTPGEQMVEVNVETTPESNDIEGESEEVNREEESTTESDLMLSAISERGESALQTSDDADVAKEDKTRDQETAQHPHPGDDVDDDDDDDSVGEPPDAGVVFIDNGQHVSRASSVATASPSPSAVAQRGSAATNKSALNREDSSNRSDSSASAKSHSTVTSRRASAMERRTPPGSQGSRGSSATKNVTTEAPVDTATSNRASKENTPKGSKKSTPRSSANASPFTSKPGSPNTGPAKPTSPASSVSPKSSKPASPKKTGSALSRGSKPASAKDSVHSKSDFEDSDGLTSKTISSSKASRSASASSRPLSARSRKSSSGIAREGTYIKEGTDDEKDLILDSARSIVDETVEKAARSLSASLHSAALSREDSKSITTSEDMVTVIEVNPAERSSSQLSSDTVIIEKGEITSEEATKELITEMVEKTAEAEKEIKTEENIEAKEEKPDEAKSIETDTVIVAPPVKSVTTKNKKATLAGNNKGSVELKKEIPVVEAQAKTPVPKKSVKPLRKGLSLENKSKKAIDAKKGESKEDTTIQTKDKASTESVNDSESQQQSAGVVVEKKEVPEAVKEVKQDDVDPKQSSDLQKSEVTDMIENSDKSKANNLIESNTEDVIEKSQKQALIADPIQVGDDADSTGLRTPDSKATTLDDSMSLPNDSGHATEEDRGSSPEIRGSDIAKAAGSVALTAAAAASGSASSKKSTRTIKRAPKGAALPPKSTAARKSPSKTRRNKSPPPPDKYLNRLKRSKSEGVSLHKLGSESPGSRVNSRASEKDGGRLSRLQSKSVTEVEQQRYEEMEKLRSKLDTLRSERKECEMQKEEMVRQVKELHLKLMHEKDSVHEMWKKKFTDEKKLTPRLEEENAKWRQELERIHRDIITKVEGRDPNDARSPFSRLETPSNKLSYKIVIAKLLQEIEDLKRRLETTKLRLAAEAKLRAMAEKDVRVLREDLIQKKIQVTLTRKETDSVIAPFYRDTIYSLHPLM